MPPNHYLLIHPIGETGITPSTMNAANARNHFGKGQPAGSAMDAARGIGMESRWRKFSGIGRGLLKRKKIFCNLQYIRAFLKISLANRVHIVYDLFHEEQLLT